MVHSAIAEPAAVPAVPGPASHWVERSLDYTYMGFTAKYTCEGLRDTVRSVLLSLGARKSDLKVQTRGCTRLEGVEPFPGVVAHFSVLEPLNANDAGGAPVQAVQWQTVDLVRLNSSGRLDAPCELLEQLKEKALPLFTSRNLNFSSSCVPHQVSLGDIQFTVDVLKSVPPAAGAAPPA